MKTATKVLTAIALLAALLSGAVFGLTLATTQGAPQEAAGAAMALYLIVAPYCVARLVGQWASMSGGGDDEDYEDLKVEADSV